MSTDEMRYVCTCTCTMYVQLFPSIHVYVYEHVCIYMDMYSLVPWLSSSIYMYMYSVVHVLTFKLTLANYFVFASLKVNTMPAWERG